MTDRFRISPVAIAIAAIVAVAAVVAASTMQPRWQPVAAALFGRPDMLAGLGPKTPAQPASAVKAPLVPAPIATAPSYQAGAAPVVAYALPGASGGPAGAAIADLDLLRGSAPSWSAWSTRHRTRAASSDSTTSMSAGSGGGGLWSLMSLQRREGPGAQGATATSSGATAAPSHFGSRRRGEASGWSAGPDRSSPVRSALFSGHHEQIAQLLAASDGPTGTRASFFGSEGGAWCAYGGPGDMSPTPEPGSMLLFATGLVAAAGAFRRRLR